MSKLDEIKERCEKATEELFGRDGVDNSWDLTQECIPYLLSLLEEKDKVYECWKRCPYCDKPIYHIGVPLAKHKEVIEEQNQIIKELDEAEAEIEKYKKELNEFKMLRWNRLEKPKE